MKIISVLLTNVVVLLASNVWADSPPETQKTTATAAVSKVAVNIEAQPLAAALNKWAEQTGMMVMVPTEGEAQTLTAPAVVGEYSAEESLAKLLSETGFTYQFVNPRTVAIHAGKGEAATSGNTIGASSVNAASEIRLAQMEAAPESNAAAGEQQPTPKDEEGGVELEEIVVTAQKRQERLTDVPISISVLTGADLDKSTAQSVTEVLSRVPGVSTNVSPQGGGTLVSVRGVTAGTPLFDGSNPVAYYLDSVPFSLVDSSIAPDTNAYDLERIEVLRGPQGTLYGASALNGVVRVLTHDADLDAFELKARTSASSTDEGGENYRGDAALNVPLVAGKLGARLVVGYQDFSGWIDKVNEEDANESQMKNARLKLNARPSDKLAIGLSSWFSRQDYGAPSIANDEGETFHEVNEASSIDYDSHGLNIEYDFPAFSLRSMTGYIDYENRGRLDYVDFFGGSILLAQGIDASILSQEVNLASTGAGPWRWTAGAIYRDGETSTTQAFPIIDFVFDWSTKSSSYAVFAELTRLFWGGKLEATVGARYFNDDVTVAEDKLAPPKVPPNYYLQKESFNSTNPRAVLTWHPEERVTVYGSYSEGFRSGAPQPYYNFTPDSPGPTAPTQPDELKNYEIGAKAELLDNRLSVDAAVYYMDWEGVHQGVAKEVDGICCVGNLINGPSASGLGLDLALTTRPLQGLQLGISFSWNDLNFDEAVIEEVPVPPGDPAVFIEKRAKGDRLSFSPEKTIGGFVDYLFALGANGFQGRFAGSVNYVSEQSWAGGRGGAVGPGDSNLIAGARFSIEAPKNWVVTVFGDNLSNEDARLYSNPEDLNPVNPATASRPRPRTVGLQLEYRF